MNEREMSFLCREEMSVLSYYPTNVFLQRIFTICSIAFFVTKGIFLQNGRNTILMRCYIAFTEKYHHYREAHVFIIFSDICIPGIANSFCIYKQEAHPSHISISSPEDDGDHTSWPLCFHYLL